MYNAVKCTSVITLTGETERMRNLQTQNTIVNKTQ